MLSCNGLAKQSSKQDKDSDDTYLMPRFKHHKTTL